MELLIRMVRVIDVGVRNLKFAIVVSIVHHPNMSVVFLRLVQGLLLLVSWTWKMLLLLLILLILNTVLTIRRFFFRDTGYGPWLLCLLYPTAILLSLWSPYHWLMSFILNYLILLLQLLLLSTTETLFLCRHLRLLWNNIILALLDSRLVRRPIIVSLFINQAVLLVKKTHYLQFVTVQLQ